MKYPLTDGKSCGNAKKSLDMQKHFSKEIWRVKCREGFQKETFQKGYGDVIASFLGKFLETNCKGSCMLALYHPEESF